MSPHTDGCRELISDLDAAVQGADVERLCLGIKRALLAALEREGFALPAPLLRPAPNGYGRRLLHRDPAGRYSAVVMVWAPGQGTLIHDHAGQWCVEAVYQGRIRVTSYALREDVGNALFRLEARESVISGKGEAGMLIPPFEHHRIENPFDELAATIHIYHRELTSCHVFLPQDAETFRRERRELCYTAD